MYVPVLFTQKNSFFKKMALHTYHAKKRKDQKKSENSSSDDENEKPPLLKTYAATISKNIFEPFLLGYTRPGTHCPYIVDTKDLKDLWCNGTMAREQAEFHQYSGCSVARDMIRFLLNDDDEQLAKLTPLMIQFQSKFQEHWMSKFLEILDSEPYIEGDGQDWAANKIKHVSEVFPKQSEHQNENFTCQAIIQSLREVYIRSHREGLQGSNGWHVIIKNILLDILGTCADVFHSVRRDTVIRIRKNHDIKDNMVLLRQRSRSSLKDEVEAFIIVVQPDLALEIFTDNVIDTSWRKGIRTLVFEVNQDEVHPVQQLQSDTSDSSDSPYDSRQAHIPGNQIIQQHLLGLMAAAEMNSRNSSDDKTQLLLRGFPYAMNTDGMLWSHNAVYLTKLHSHIGKMDRMAHDINGKYIISSKNINPWRGHWNDIVQYWFAASMGYNVLKDPSQTNAQTPMPCS